MSETFNILHDIYINSKIIKYYQMKIKINK